MTHQFPDQDGSAKRRGGTAEVSTLLVCFLLSLCDVRWLGGCSVEWVVARLAVDLFVWLYRKFCVVFRIAGGTIFVVVESHASPNVAAQCGRPGAHHPRNLMKKFPDNVPRDGSASELK